MQHKGGAVGVSIAVKMNVIGVLLQNIGKKAQLLFGRIAFQYLSLRVKPSIGRKKIAVRGLESVWFLCQHFFSLLVGHRAMVDDSGSLQLGQNPKPEQNAQEHACKHSHGKTQQNQGQAYTGLSFRHLYPTPQTVSTGFRLQTFSFARIFLICSAMAEEFPSASKPKTAS